MSSDLIFKIKIKNFKTILDQEFSIHQDSRMICLIGANDSGKTNLIDAIFKLGKSIDYLNISFDDSEKLMFIGNSKSSLNESPTIEHNFISRKNNIKKEWDEISAKYDKLIQKDFYEILNKSDLSDKNKMQEEFNAF